MCYDYQNGIIDEEDILFTTELELFSIRTISLPKTIQFMKTTYVGIMDTNVNISFLEHGSEVQSIEKKILGNRYELEVALEDKVYPEHTTIINQGVL